MQKVVSQKQKLRRRFLLSKQNEGAETEPLSEAELIELLLSYPIANRDAAPIARALAARFGSLEGLLRAEAPELLSMPGIMQDTAAYIKLIDSVCQSRRPPAEQAPAAAGPAPESAAQDSSPRPRLASVRLAAEYCAGLLKGCDTECVAEVLLDKDSRVLWDMLVARGGGQSVELPVSLLASNAKRPGVRGVVIAHNHPSGSPAPSAADIASTRALAAELNNTGVRLYEHIITGEEACYAMLSDAMINASDAE